MSPNEFSEADAVEVGKLIQDCVGWIPPRQSREVGRHVLSSTWFGEYRQRVARELSSLGVIRVETAATEQPKPTRYYTGD